MKKTLLFLIISLCIPFLNAGGVKKTYSFGSYNLSQSGNYSRISFEGTKLSGIPGEPILPYKAVSLLLPPGESAVSIEISGTTLVEIPGTYVIDPLQYSQPISSTTPAPFVKNEQLYSRNMNYPSDAKGNLMTQYLSGYSVALSTFTPVVYNPATGKASYYPEVTVTVKTAPTKEGNDALLNLTSSVSAIQRVKMLVQNKEMMDMYPSKKSSAEAYQVLIITPSQFENAYTDLTDFYATTGITAHIETTENIDTQITGNDLPEKMRNYIIQEYQNNGIEYVLLGGDVEHVPYRGFYCYAISGSGYEDYNIPADIYFAGLDGNWNTNGDNKWAEPGEEDVLPEIAVSRFPFSTITQLNAIIHKTVSYQSTPVEGEWKEPYLVSENLYDDPLTFGSDYLELIVDQHNDNGYSTFGIPSADNMITRLYDTLISPPSNYWAWTKYMVIDGINEGKTFIHHVGHSNETYMMRLVSTDITNANFSMVNGVDHNYTLMYTHGCICGAFDFNDCIAENAINIDNFLVGGVFNSRYGWFNQGTTDGPSAHIHREFISAMYNDTFPETHLGTAHTISKIMTAPFIALPGEFEPGAQRWCMYDCNAFGDPSLKIWTDEPSGVGVPSATADLRWSVYPIPAKETLHITYDANSSGDIKVSMINTLGQTVKASTFTAFAHNKNSFAVDINDLRPGAYLCRIDADGHSAVKKVMVVR